MKATETPYAVSPGYEGLDEFEAREKAYRDAAQRANYCDGCDAVDGQCNCGPNCGCDSHCRGKHPLSAVLAAAKTVRIDGSDYLISDPDSWPKEIQGDLDLRSTRITRLPQGLTVGGDLDLGGTPIAQLPQGLQVGGDLDLGGTPLANTWTDAMKPPGCRGTVRVS